MSIIAVMMIGAGLDKTGMMSKVAGYILKVGGTAESRIIPIVSGTAGIISSFMQNVGAAALLLPVVSRISARSGLPMSRLLMPMGFTAILGGTITMVGSSPLILLNDLILTSNVALPADQQMQTWSLFSVTPIGLALVTTGILYFVLAGKYVLPSVSTESTAPSPAAASTWRKFTASTTCCSRLRCPRTARWWGRCSTTSKPPTRFASSPSRLPAQVCAQVAATCRVISRSAPIRRLGVLCSPAHLKDFVDAYGLTIQKGLRVFSEALASTQAGIAEIVIPPGSSLIGKSARDIWMRKAYGLAMVALHRDGETLVEGEQYSRHAV